MLRTKPNLQLFVRSYSWGTLAVVIGIGTLGGVSFQLYWLRTGFDLNCGWLIVYVYNGICIPVELIKIINTELHIVIMEAFNKLRVENIKLLFFCLLCSF